MTLNQSMTIRFRIGKLFDLLGPLEVGLACLALPMLAASVWPAASRALLASIAALVVVQGIAISVVRRVEKWESAERAKLVPRDATREERRAHEATDSLIPPKAKPGYRQAPKLTRAEREKILKSIPTRSN